jgi:tRNA(Ile)-lysidine synthase
LQGSVLKSGIKNKRDIYFRPMLNISRCDIEAYATENQIEYCIDSTNLENNYLRNKIRNQLMPVLDSIFVGWQSGVLAAGEKLSDVEKLIEKSLKDLNWNIDFDNGFAYFDFGDFSKLDKCLKINFLYKGLESYFHLMAAKNPNIVAEFVRFPYQLLEKFVADYQSVDFEKILISKENGNIFIGKVKKGYDNKGFYTIIDNVGLYDLDFGQIQVVEKVQNRFVAKLVGTDYVSGEFLLPVVIRSKDDSDFIEDKNKNKKNVTKIFSEWKVLEEDKNSIPIFSDVKIRGLWGEPFNAENFFVKIDEEL